MDMMFFRELIFGILILAYCQNVWAQAPVSLPSSGKHHSALSSGSPSHASFQELENCVSKIQQLHRHYEESGERLDEVKGEADQNVRDSLWMVLKEDMEQRNREQIALFSEIENELPEEFESLKNAAAYNRQIMETRGREIPEWEDYGRLEDYLDIGKENLRAFTDEHLAEAGRDYFGNQTGAGLSGALLSDDYGDYLGLHPRGLKAKADPGLNKHDPGRLSGRKPDISKVPKKNFRLIEKNRLKGSPLKERLTAGMAVNSLDAIQEGFNLNFHAGFRITHQVSLLAGPTWKKVWQNDGLSGKPAKEGAGIQTGARFSLSQWLGQASWERNRVEINYPSGAPVENYRGTVNYLLIGLGRTMTLRDKWNAVIMGIYDVGFQNDRRLHNSPFLLRMGIEFN